MGGTRRSPLDVDDRGAVGKLVGRESEIASIERLLDDVRRSRGGVLLLRGEAGAGKSALLEGAVGRARGLTVLRVVGVEPESELAFAALHRLLHPVLEHAGRIPDVQAEALRIAMGISPGETENRFLIALAVLSLLSEVADAQPVLCVVDDAQWLDQPSADALAFVARRLEAERIVMLFAVRDGDAGSFPGARLPELSVGALHREAAEELLVDRFDGLVAPEVRRILVEAAKGLPLALLEMPSALTAAQLSGHEALPRPMPMGHQLEAILLARVHALPAAAQLLLLVAAAEGSGEAEVVLSAAGVMELPSSALVEAEESGCIRTEGTELVFRHPLLRSAIYQEASLPQRQAVHRALVEVLGAERHNDARAWHRAALVLSPDDRIAGELERTADRARRRGGYAAAARALRRSAELTSSDAGRTRRLVAAARAAWDAGLPDDALMLLRAADDDTDATSDAERRHVQGEIEFNCGVPLRGTPVLMEGARRVAGADPHKALQMLFDAAHCANASGDLSAMAAVAETASSLLVAADHDDASLVDLLVGAIGMLHAKDTSAKATLLRALDGVHDVTDPRALTWAGAAAALVGDRERDEGFRRRAESVARSSMAVGTLAMVLARMSWTELTNYGQVVSASRHAEEGLQLALEAGLSNAACFHRAVLAWAAAMRGDDETCVSLADQATTTALGHGLGAYGATANWAVGLLHLGHGRWDEAAARLESLWSSPPEVAHPYVVLRAIPDLVEAAVRTGMLAVAESAARRLAEYAGEDAPDAMAAVSVRCRALIAAELDVKEKLLTEALMFHDRDPRPFERARTLLLVGETLRRQRRRADARTPLRSALDAFDQLGAHPWSERARRELRATGQTVRRREPMSEIELTRQERQVARLVAEGGTNREVAAHLFVSPRTVEYHLRSVFSKLGISSRAELVRLLLQDPSRI